MVEDTINGHTERTVEGIRIVLGDVAGSAAPLITCAADFGFACGKAHLQAYADSQLFELATAMREYADGALVAFVDQPAAKRRLVLVQADQEGRFYETRHSGSYRGWGDFYFAAAFAAFTGAEARWHAETVCVSHLSLSGWKRNVAGATLEAMGYAVRALELPSLRNVVLDSCQPNGRVRDELELLDFGKPFVRPELSPVPFDSLGVGEIRGVEVVKANVGKDAFSPERPLPRWSSTRPGQERDVERIDVLVEQLRRYWHRYPDQRLGRLLSNVVGPKPSPFFYVEDDVISERLLDPELSQHWPNVHARPPDWLLNGEAPPPETAERFRAIHDRIQRQGGPYHEDIAELSDICFGTHYGGPNS